jgi:putative chitinase
MRLTNIADFKASGWQVTNKAIGAIVNGIIATQQTVFAKYGITKDLHIVHLMAQISHECGKGTDMTESLNYSAKALLDQWSSHFTVAQTNNYGRTANHPANQKMIGELAYGGRMGNAPAPAEDGFTYRGRGLIQTTGKDAYKELGKRVGLDLVNNPELLNDSSHALECAVDEFVRYPKMLNYCEKDDLLAVSSLINLGHVVNDSKKVIGYSQRAAQLKLWKKQYGI